MKKLLLTLACLATIAGSAFSQSASFTLTDNGQYGGTTASGTFSPTDTFTLSLFGDINGFTSNGYSFFLQAPTANGFNMTLQVTAASFVQFTDPSSGYPQTFTNTTGGPSAGNLSTGDLGATGNINGSQNATGNGILLANYTFSLAGAPAGTYTITSTTQSGFTNAADFSFVPGTPTSYTVTVASAVPEPSTWACLIGGAALLGANFVRRSRKA